MQQDFNNNIYMKQKEVTSKINKYEQNINFITNVFRTSTSNQC